MFSAVFGSSESTWEIEGLSAPKSKKEYAKLAKQVLADRCVKLASNGWEIVQEAKECDDITIEKKELPGSGVAAVRVTGFAKMENGKTIDDLANDMFNPSEKFQKRLYESVTSYKRIKKISSSIVVGRTIGSTSGISDREFIAMRTIEKNDDGYLIALQSINDEEFPHDPNCVRGTFCNGMQLTPLSDTIIQITSYEHIDPRGWVPGMVINSFISSAGGWISKV